MRRKSRPVTSYQLPITSWRGQSLVEVIISLGVVVILAVSLVTTGLITQKASRTARNNTQATKLAEQNIEQVRIFRDRKGYLQLPADAPCYTLSTTDSNPANWQFYTASCPNGELITLNNTQFFRKISVVTAGADRKSITVMVSWTDSGGTRTVSNNTILSDWEGAQ